MVLEGSIPTTNYPFANPIIFGYICSFAFRVFQNSMLENNSDYGDLLTPLCSFEMFYIFTFS